MKKIAILGAGSWGTALAMVLAENQHEARLWGNNEAQIKEINERHTNEHFLPGVFLDPSIRGYLDLAEAVKDVDAILFVLPTKAIRIVAKQLNDLLKNKPMIIHASKGLEQETYKRISEILAEELDRDRYEDIVVLSGPSHAEEVSRRDITTITAACENIESAKYVQKLFSNSFFRVYTNTDCVGVEMGAALKNVIAVGAGALHGLGYGDNAKAALMTRGLTEISRLGVAFGADPLTFIGLSGVGDLIVTCASRHSRNRKAGVFIGQGKTMQEAMDEVKMVVEGVYSAKAAKALAEEYGVSMPIVEQVNAVLFENKAPKDAVDELMQREKNVESQALDW